MTEELWLSSPWIRCLLRCLPEDAERSERKQRLFGVACCRRAAEWVEHPDIPPIIDLCERAADATALRKRLPGLAARIRYHLVPRVQRAFEAEGLPWILDALAHLAEEPEAIAWIVELCQSAMSGDHYWFVGEDYFLADLFRDIFGNPFRTVAFDPNWHTSIAVGLASYLYESRDFSLMPILADALEEAGCENPDILSHCRGDGPHVRGCWVVDLVLGKT